MVQAKTLIIDADAHVLESDRTWDYLTPSEQKYRPIGVTIPGDGSIGRRDRDVWVVDGTVKGNRFSNLSEEELIARSKLMGRNQVTSQAAREMDDVQGRLRDMDTLGIDVQVLHSTIFIEEVTGKPAIEVALCRSYNRWLADIHDQGKGRLRWTCVPPLLSIPDAIDEIRFAKEHGAVGVLIRPFENGNRIMTDPYFYPVLEEAQRLDLPIASHISNSNTWYIDFIKQQVGTDAGAHAFGEFFVPAAIAAHALVLSPIPDLFPTLRWGIIEATASWIPWVMRDLKERFKNRGQELPRDILSQKRIFSTFENEDDVPYIIDCVGPECLMIGTDYGHTDTASDIEALRVFRERGDISEAAKDKILNENAKAFYHF